MTYDPAIYTFIETPTFKAEVEKLWGEDERLEFIAWLATDPEVGAVIPGSGGCRKVRWSRRGSGKRGGVRVIYFNDLVNGNIWLLMVYPKSAVDSIPAHLLKAIREEIEHE